MWNHRLREWMFRRAMTLAVFPLFLIVGLLAAATTAHADPGADNAVLLDPFDPVPEIQFRHFGADCFSACGAYGNGCYQECGYRCHYGCYHRRRHCEHCGETWRDQRSDWQAFRYDNQSNRYDRFSRRYDRQSHEWDVIVNGGWFDGQHFWHDGHGRWRDGHGDWHHEDGWIDPHPGDPPGGMPPAGMQEGAELFPPDAGPDFDDGDGPPPPPDAEASPPPDDDGWEYGGVAH